MDKTELRAWLSVEFWIEDRYSYVSLAASIGAKS